MFVKLWIIFLLFCPLTYAETCEKEKIEECYLEYVKIYNFSSLPPFDVYQPFSFSGRQENWTLEEILCKNFNLTLFQCIENDAKIDLSSQCFKETYPLLKSIDIYYYVIDYKIKRFQCQGQGYQVFKETYPCENKFEDEDCEIFQNGPSNCLEYQNYTECSENEAFKVCGEKFRDFYTTKLEIMGNVTFGSCNYEKNPSNPSSPNNKFIWYFLIGVGIVIFMIIILILIIKIIRIKKKKNIIAIDMNKKKNSYNMQISIPSLTNNLTSKFSEALFIPESNVIIDFNNILGKGAMGSVYSATITSTTAKPKTNNETTNIVLVGAIKIPIQSITTNTSFDYFEEFEHELKISMLLQNHKNTICVAHAWTMYRELPCLIFEKMDGGNLFNFVQSFNDPKKSKEFPPNRLFLQYLWQISDALMFLASLKLVHRDVATRNILMAYPNIVKLSDFGLCSECDEDSLTYLSSLYKKLPIKWLSPEAMNLRIFSEKSDVWAFGIMMWEIWSKGETPYVNLNYIELVESLKNNFRLEPPISMPEEFGSIMISCWDENPENRATFQNLKEIFQNLLEKESSHYGYLSFEENNIE